MKNPYADLKWVVVAGGRSIVKGYVGVLDLTTGRTVASNGQSGPTALDPHFAPLVAEAPEMLRLLIEMHTEPGAVFVYPRVKALLERLGIESDPEVLDFSNIHYSPGG